jgi:Peptidase S46
MTVRALSDVPAVGRLAKLKRLVQLLVAAGAALLVVAAAEAEEGVWTFDNLPSKVLQTKYGFATPSPSLAALRLSAVRFGGASAAFVSGDGLLLTNHHVALACVQKLSTAGEDLVRNGFFARTRAAERPCPGTEIKHLDSTQDVTAAVRSAVRSTESAVANAERNAAIAALENECKEKTGFRCEMVTLYRGGAYHLYRYRVWTDVRLVFAPESRVAFFGGDADNFVYPRFDLDFALARVYDHGRPVKSPHYLRWVTTGVKDGDLVFAAGHPYSTDRLITLSQLEFDRDVRYPLMIASAKRQIQVLQEFGARSSEATRRAADRLFGTENWLKAMTGEYKALQRPALMAAKANDESLLRRSFVATPGRVDPWAAIEAATRKEGDQIKAAWAVGYGYGTLFDTVGTIVELANESTLPEAERLASYRPSAIPRLMLRVAADEPIYKDLEIARLTGYWQEALDILGKDDPFVKRVLGDKTPLAAATAIIDGTRMNELQERKRLLDGGLAAVAASTDPLVELAREIYPMRRRVAKLHEVDVETPTLQAGDELERTRFELFGTDAYPDATGSLRLSYGTVRGYDADGVLTPWQTNFLGLLGRSAAFGAQPPFDLPSRWSERRRNLDLSTPLNFVSTLDIIGGNSGSPVVNRNGELVGLVFDGNLEGLGGRFVYTDDKARAIAVDSRAIVEALTKIYDARDVVREITRR